MERKQFTRTGAILRFLLYTTAAPIAFAIIAVIYTLIVGSPEN
jgi:hypothetical protein